MYDLHIYFGKYGSYGVYVKGIVYDPKNYKEILNLFSTLGFFVVA